MTARSAPRHQDDRHKSVKVNTSKSRTLDEASEECASKLFQLHRECLPAIHFIQSADHQQSLKPEVVKDEALRRQQELENEARTLQAGCSVRLDINNKKGFEGPDLERHPSNRFAAPKPRGQQKSEAKLDVKRRKLADGGTVFDLMKASANAPLSEEAKRGRLHTAMHDSKFGLLAKVVPYLLFWAFGSVARCVSPHAARAFVHTWLTGQFHRVAVLIVAIIMHLEVADEVRKVLQERTDASGISQDHATAMYIVNQLAASLEILLHCTTARSRRALGTILTAIAPDRGQASRVSRLLRINRNSLRLKAAMRRRNMIFKDWTEDYFVIKVGKRVVNKRGEIGVVTAVDLEKMTCSVEIFCSDGSTYIKDFTTKGKKRMRVIEPEFGPEKQKVRSDATSDSVKYAIVNFYRLHCATSPCAKHRVRQRIANKKCREEQMLVMQHTFDDLYGMFMQAHQSSPKLSKVSRTMFYRLRPWYLRFAKVDSCLCSCCENYAGYMEGIRIIAAYLRDVLKVTGDLERKLVSLGECKHKKEHMDILLCAPSERTAQCINGSCKLCGFKRLWSEGLRPKIVDKDGDITQGYLRWMRVFKSFRYEMIDKETGKTTREGDAEEPACDDDGEWHLVKPKKVTRMLDRVEKQGSIVDFLDDWEPVFVRMCHHRDTIARCKDADVEYERNAQPGWLKIDCDFAENFTILKKRQLQSQYWSQLQCTIFVCVVSFVDKATFDDTAVALAEGDEVTVVTDAGHSFWAKVEQVDHTGTDTRYHVRDALGNGT